MANLYQKYRDEIRPKLQKDLDIKNPMAVPKITKITINMGVGEAIADRKVMEAAVADMTAIAGQQPVVCLARRSEAGFKIREGYPIGCKVTLRRQRMYDFIERLVDIAIPRIRDFRGLNPKAFDGRGNFSMGISEQIVFAEIDYDKIDKIRGMDITITTTAETNDEAKELLKFCRKFTVPMRQALRGKGILLKRDDDTKNVLHICFVARNKFAICVRKTCHTNLLALNILLKMRKYPINSYLPQIIKIFNKK